MKQTIIYLLLLISTGAGAQKFNIYGGAGHIVFSSNQNINFEYSAKVYENGNKLNLKLEFGKYKIGGFGVDISNESYRLAPQIVYLMGKKHHFFELGAGMNFEVKSIVGNKGKLLITGNLGYRFEYSALILRVGLSFPEGLYISAGFRF